MTEEKSPAYTKAENRVVVVVLLAFVVWCPMYLVAVRPALNAVIGNYISSYPAMLHLLPIFGPIVLLAWLMGRGLPRKTE